jgi:aspartate/tyrosine/aromatic aminotransferase
VVGWTDVLARGAKKRWVEGQREYVQAFNDLERLKWARRRYHAPAAYGGYTFGLLRAMMDVETAWMAEVDAAKARLREVRTRLGKQYDESKRGEEK